MVDHSVIWKGVNSTSQLVPVAKGHRCSQPNWQTSLMWLLVFILIHCYFYLFTADQVAARLLWPSLQVPGEIGQDLDELLRACHYKCLWTLTATVWVWNSVNWIKILFSQTAAAFPTYMATGTRGEDTESQFVLYVRLCCYFPPDLPLENFKEWSRAREWSAFLLTEAGRQRHGLSKSYINLQSPLFCFFWQPCKIHPCTQPGLQFSESTLVQIPFSFIF